MKRSLQASRTSQFPESVDHRLNTYALAASATGDASAGAACRGQDRYSPADKYLTNGSIALNVNHDRIVDFVIEDNFQGHWYFLGVMFCRATDRYSRRHLLQPG
jgi:hypothetical protein